ncbi:beta-lactamase-like protein [Hyaloraphidium curvatum]|nr:beta-lactamase-like protein [Hyaloraphidium curvatum]
MALPHIEVIPLGAGQDVGRSCILLRLNGKRIMLDCGMHMGYTDERRFPDFSFIAKDKDLTDELDCVIISHFHLDHCGGLPYLTEVVGYRGPVYMTYPTKAICPLLLEDFRRIVTGRQTAAENEAARTRAQAPDGATPEPEEVPLRFFTAENVARCMDKVIAVDLGQVIKVADDLEIKCYYAGHVLGAAMFHIRSGNQSVVYTGDYNMTPDRHLGSAWIDRCRPDVLITETTYATTIRDSKRSREREFLQKIYNCVKNGGKVLIPVFALGRAQELCILVDSFWERMQLSHIPVYFSQGMTARANEYYKLFVQWTNQKIKRTFVDRNPFGFNHVRALEDHGLSYEREGPMVLFATPGMLHAGTSLEAFKKWCGDPRNMVIMPGYCVPGTVGAKVLAGNRQIDVDRWTHVTVNMAVENLSFSAHADAKGILQLVRMCEPRSVVLVHGEKHKMAFLKQRINQELGIAAYFPANGETVSVPASREISGVRVEEGLIEKAWTERRLSMRKLLKSGNWKAADIKPVQSLPVRGVLEWDRRDKRERDPGSDEGEGGEATATDAGSERGTGTASEAPSTPAPEPPREVFEDPEFGAFAHRLDDQLQIGDPNEAATPDPGEDSDGGAPPRSRPPRRKPARAADFGALAFLSPATAQKKHGMPPRSVANVVRKPFEVRPPPGSGFTTPEVRDGIRGKLAEAIARFLPDVAAEEADGEAGRVLRVGKGGGVTVQVRDSDVVVGWMGPGEDEELGERVVSLVEWAVN